MVLNLFMDENFCRTLDIFVTWQMSCLDLEPVQLKVKDAHKHLALTTFLPPLACHTVAKTMFFSQ